ncbi:hypothetical protein [Methylocystis sp. B8]|uniref:hypothetical protein n=1 Tax=Methylocystis sp. B8 TaxID=544938 RepID=UPI0010FD2273|nr:hypothetical protein [Methylocystis sp. B8]TLG75091.1 hypothetical protein FEV16_11260 [Methylocystis sp. B8]
MNLSPAAVTIAALVAIVAGAACFYLGAPNQRWLPRRLPSWPSRVACAALLFLGVFIWSQAVQLSTAIFATLALTMLLFIIFPWLGALRTVIRNAP